MPLSTRDLTLQGLRAAYAAGSLTPTEVCRQLLPAIASSQAVFIARPKDEDVLERCRSARLHCACARGAGLPTRSLACWLTRLGATANVVLRVGNLIAVLAGNPSL